MPWHGAGAPKMFSGTVAGGTQGDNLLGTVDLQGMKGVQGIGRDHLLGTTFHLHPDGSQMLITMYSEDESLTIGTWDVYLYRING